MGHSSFTPSSIRTGSESLGMCSSAQGTSTESVESGSANEHNELAEGRVTNKSSTWMSRKEMSEVSFGTCAKGKEKETH